MMAHITAVKNLLPHTQPKAMNKHFQIYKNLHTCPQYKVFHSFICDCGDTIMSPPQWKPTSKIVASILKNFIFTFLSRRNCFSSCYCNISWWTGPESLLKCCGSSFVFISLLNTHHEHLKATWSILRRYSNCT